MSQPTEDFWNQAERFFLIGWVIGIVVLLFWMLAILFLKGPIYNIHAALFGLKLHELDLIMYCGLGLWKLQVLMLFFLPWLSIRLRTSSFLQRKSVS